MRIPLVRWFVFSSMLLAPTCWANNYNPQFSEIGQNTVSVTHWAETGFERDTDKLKDLALKDAADYCAKQHKELKVISTTLKRPKVPLTGFAYAKVVFKALASDDPELHASITPIADAASPAAAISAQPASPTDSLYSDLMKLDDLRKRGILTDEEFQAQKKKRLEKSN